MNTIQEQLAAIETANNTGNYAQTEELCRQLLAQELQPEEKAIALLHLSASLWRRGFIQESLPFAQESFSIAERAENKELQAKTFGNIATVFAQIPDYPHALEYYHQALKINEELGNKKGVASNLGNIGVVYENLSEYPRALEYYYQALKINEELGNKKGVAENLGNIGGVYINLSNYLQALEYYQQGLTIFQELDNKSTVAMMLGNIGNVYLQISNYPRALEYYNQAVTVLEELGNKRSAAYNLGNIGVVHYKLSDYPRALEYFHQALKISEEVSNGYGVTINLGNIANVYSELSDYPRALEYYHQALALAEKLGNTIGEVENLNNIGVVYNALSDYPRALEYYCQALKINEKLGNKKEVAENLGNIGVVYGNLSDYPRALEYLQQALAINTDLGNTVSVAENLSYLGGLYIKTDFIDYNPAKAEEYLLQAITLFQELGTKRVLYEAYKSLADLCEQQERWQEQVQYLKKYYATEKEVQSEETKKQADKFAFERQIAVMEKEREVTDMLLHKFLPSPIVSDIKAREGKILVKKYNNISVLFADLVGFTKLSLSIEPATMIEMLNFIFTKFDVIIKQAGGHRLRTIGDGYFAVCGAPDMVENHQYTLARAALAMQQNITLPQHIKQGLPEGTVLGIRIGLHCGEAVCGMVGGLEKWQYDAYGDTVNTASRMESHGEAGKIHVSAEFKNALAEYDEFTFIAREPMYIKGKGMMNTFFLS